MPGTELDYLRENAKKREKSAYFQDLCIFVRVKYIVDGNIAVFDSGFKFKFLIQLLCGV